MWFIFKKRWKHLLTRFIRPELLGNKTRKIEKSKYNEKKKEKSKMINPCED